MPLVGLDSDSGREFINTFTRRRAQKKNDSAPVEQKNGAIVRQLIGYDRFAWLPYRHRGRRPARWVGADTVFSTQGDP